MHGAPIAPTVRRADARPDDSDNQEAERAPTARSAFFYSTLETFSLSIGNANP